MKFTQTFTYQDKEITLQVRKDLDQKDKYILKTLEGKRFLKRSLSDEAALEKNIAELKDRTLKYLDAEATIPTSAQNKLEKLGFVKG